MNECNQEEIERVIGLYANMVYKLVYCHCGKTCDADDIFQEVFIRLISTKKQFESEEHRKAWLIRVSINCCNNHFREQKKHEKLSRQLVFEQSACERQACGQELFGALGALPEKYRVVLHLFYYEDMPTKEIAAALGIGEVAVRSRLTRARKRLKEQLSKEEAGNEGKI